VLTFALVGCAKPPVTELDASRAALKAAEDSEAATYAAAELQEAKDALAAAETEIATQEGKFALMRKYDEAKNLISTATNKADVAKRAAETGKEAAIQAANTALEGVTAAMTAAEATMVQLEACPKKPKGFDADLATLHGNMDAMRAEITNIQNAITAENYSGATTQADALKGQIDTLSMDLSAAMTKIKCVPAVPAS
jgi:hypothetical protein